MYSAQMAVYRAAAVLSCVRDGALNPEIMFYGGIWLDRRAGQIRRVLWAYRLTI
jgi:hypothetical protein